jgi:Hypervirulence associated proteins TUDOR domain
MMTKRFKVGDHVTWNSEAGHVSGKIIKVHTKDVDYKGHTHHASEDDPQYEIKSSKTEHTAMHKGQVLTKTSAWRNSGASLMTKRPAATDDGTRILIDRLAARGQESRCRA